MAWSFKRAVEKVTKWTAPEVNNIQEGIQEAKTTAASAKATAESAEALAKEVVPSLRIGMNGLFALNSSVATNMGISSSRTEIEGGFGSVRQHAFGKSNQEGIESRLTGSAFCLAIYNPCVSEGVKAFRAQTGSQALTIVQVEEDIKAILKWIEEKKYTPKQIALEFLNEPYDQYEWLFSLKEYAEMYVAAHKILSPAGFTLLATAWGKYTVGVADGRVETTVATTSAAKAKEIEVASTTGAHAGGSILGRIVVGNEQHEIESISGKKVKIASEFTEEHKSGAKVFLAGMAGESSPEGGGGWCKVFCEKLAEAIEAPRVPDGWSFHPYGAIGGRGTFGNSTAEGPENAGWLSAIRFLDLLAEDGISAPMHITEMGNAKSGEGGIAGPELSQEGVEETLLKYCQDAYTKGMASFYGFYTITQLEASYLQKTVKRAVTATKRHLSRVSVTEKELEFPSGEVKTISGFPGEPRACGAEILGKQKSEFIITVTPELASSAVEGYWVLKFKLYNLKGEASGTTTIKKLSYWAEW